MTAPELINVPALQSFTLAIVLFFVGQWLGSYFPIIRRYSIPEPVVGGFLCALVVGILYFAFGLRIEFDLQFRDVLLLYFFAAIGLNADIGTLIRGGKPLVVLLVLASVFIVLQNGLGMSIAALFGLDPRAGLMTGSVSLTGGVGTTLAWAPFFVERLGITNAMELGMASNMIGLIAACVVGGPIASFLMGRHKVSGSTAEPLDVGVSNEKETVSIDYFGVLTAWMWLNVALIIGETVTPTSGAAPESRRALDSPIPSTSSSTRVPSPPDRAPVTTAWNVPSGLSSIASRRRATTGPAAAAASVERAAEDAAAPAPGEAAQRVSARHTRAAASPCRTVT